MAATKTKFMFDADFATGAAQRPVGAAEHGLKLAEAESNGFRNGYAAAEADSERRIALAFEQIRDGISRLVRGLAVVEARLEAETVEVAVAVGRKLAPALIQRQPFEEIAAVATDCFRQLVTAPHVAVRMSDTLQANARARLEAIAREQGFQGRLIVIDEPDLAAGDCRIEWADGGVTRSQASIDAAVGEAIRRYLEATHEMAAPKGSETTP